MPKINVYLPDDLADAVRAAGVPVSAVCQRALEQAVRRVTAIRETVLGDLDDAALAARLPNFTARARAVLRLAAARPSPVVGTGQLLGGLVEEGSNLALHVLRAIEIDPARVTADLAARPLDESAPDAPAHSDPASGVDGTEAGDALSRPGAGVDGTDVGHGLARPGAGVDSTDVGHGSARPGAGAGREGRRFSVAAAGALELAVTEATALGHNYVGCEHLLLGLIAEPDGAGGQTLRSLGAELRLTRRAVAAALAGYVHLQANQAAAAPADKLMAVLSDLTARIERLEQRA